MVIALFGGIMCCISDDCNDFVDGPKMREGLRSIEYLQLAFSILNRIGVNGLAKSVQTDSMM